MKSHFTVFLFVIVILLFPRVWANQSNTQTPDLFEYLKNGHFYFHIGGFNATQGKSQDIGIEGLIGDHFTVTQHNDQNVLFGLGYFRDTLQTDSYHFLFGLDTFYLPQTAVKGDIIQEELFTNLSYRYFITNIPIFFATKAYFKIKNNTD
ncbi:MAG TPA: hypothetical protein VHM20_04595, partial [Gammaproteobacteria bacterium]|nr:hypothetical protein [Gammaproteobacteria bacterium]